MTKAIMALDQGTTSSRTILFDREGKILAMAQQETTQHYPKPGWVEQDPEEIWSTQTATAREAMNQAGLQPRDIHAVGITNQRETTALWHRKTGKPLAPAIVWQDRRTADWCAAIHARGDQPMLRERTGLLADAYFSATKLAWLLEEHPEARGQAERGELAFGTVDSWLAYRLTGGRHHVTDPSNASRTLLYNVRTREWDPELLAYFYIPRGVLPRVIPTAQDELTTDADVFGAEVPLAAMIGDQQAALFGQACVHPGMSKITYGTGAFLLTNTGAEPAFSESGLLTSVAWHLAGALPEQVQYTTEGAIFIAGAAIQWLRDELGLLDDAARSEAMARAVEDTDGVFLVPAFVGLGAPYWNSEARGALVGLTRGTNRNHIVRAAIEAMAYQTADLLETTRHDWGGQVTALHADGGAAANDFLCQFQADLLGLPVNRPQILETTAAGAAYLAGLATGFWDGLDAVTALRRTERTFTPQQDDAWRAERMAAWRQAVRRVL